jgi:hypothetical protein
LCSFIDATSWWSSTVELVGEGWRGGQRAALSTARQPVRRQAHRPQIHRAAALRKVCLQVPAQPVPPLSFELVPEHVGVQVLAFVAKPEQLPERTSHVARMGYDKRHF